MEQGLENPRILWNPMINYCLEQSDTCPTLAHILSQVNAVHTLQA